MKFRLTNESLNGLLQTLGFEPCELVREKFRRWRHPESHCEIMLPANKLQESPRPANLVGIKDQLNMQGHLDEESFDFFVAEGKLPARST